MYHLCDKSETQVCAWYDWWKRELATTLSLLLWALIYDATRSCLTPEFSVNTTHSSQSFKHQPGTKLLFYKNIVWAISCFTIILFKTYRFFYSFLVKSYMKLWESKACNPSSFWPHIDQVRVNIVNVIFQRLQKSRNLLVS